MAMATKIISRSIDPFMEAKSYQLFASMAGLLVFPASFFTLLSPALLSSSVAPVLQIISDRLWLLFKAAAFPASEFFVLLNLKLTQTIFCFIFTLPFALTFLLLAKVSIIQVVNESSRRRRRRRRSLPLLSSYRPVLLTHLFNSFVMLSANATVYSILFIVFNAADLVGLASNSSVLLLLSAAGFILYAVVIANVTVICNLSIVVAAMEGFSGCLALAKACVLVRGRVATALALAAADNLAMALAEALFQYRLITPYYRSRNLDEEMIGEACLIAYVHSLLVVLDVIVSCMFFDRCYGECSELEPEEKTALQGSISDYCCFHIVHGLLPVDI